MAGRAVGPVAVQRSDGALERLLSEVVGGVGIAEIPAHLPDVALGLGDESLQGVVVAVTRADQELGQVIHRRQSIGAISQSAPSLDRPVDRSPGTEAPAESTRQAWNACHLEN